MKILSSILLLIVLVSFKTQAAQTPVSPKATSTPEVEVGRYTALDDDSKTVQAKLEIRVDGTLNFKVKTPDFTMPEPGCEGKFEVKGNLLSSHLTCPTELLPEADVKIDIGKVNAVSLRSDAGAAVNVVIDALGEDPIKFHIKKADVEIGKYTALDAETKTVQASFELRENGTVNFKVKTPDFSIPEPGCEGEYKVKGFEVTADLLCPTDLLPEANVKIDVTNVNSHTLRTEPGAAVSVVIDALGEEPIKFLLLKADAPKKAGLK